MRISSSILLFFFSVLIFNTNAQTKKLKLSVTYLSGLEKNLSKYDLNIIILGDNKNQKTFLAHGAKPLLIDAIEDSQISIVVTCLAYCGDAEKSFSRFISDVKLTDDSTVSLNISFPLNCNYNLHAFNKVCPKCKKTNRVIPILYGDRIPVYDKNGNIVRSDPEKSKMGECNTLDGCCATWYCERDKLSF